MAKTEPSARQREIDEAVADHGSAAAAAAALGITALTVDRALSSSDQDDPDRPCWTCGRPPTGRYADGSPRYDHGHDPVSGAAWSRSLHENGARLCPACCHEHPALTTCRECPVCRAGDLTDVVCDVFADLLPGGAEDRAELGRSVPRLISIDDDPGKEHP